MSRTILITPNKFIAGAGKLDSDYRYLRRSVSPVFYLAAGKTMDVRNGGARYVAPSGSVTLQDGQYNGTFAGGGSIGVTV